jgi:hypothetical protein
MQSFEFLVQSEINFDRQKGNFGSVKNKRINDAIEDFFERVKAAAFPAWQASDVPVGTGKLSSEGFGVGRIRKTRSSGGTSFTLNMGVGRLETSRPKWAGSVGESYYPRFVQEGTIGPIFGKGMPIRDKQRNIIEVSGGRDKKGRFKKKKELRVNSVKGQAPNPYMDRFNRNMNIAVRSYKGNLTRRVGNIIKE